MESKVIQISKKIQREDEVMTKQKAEPLISPYAGSPYTILLPKETFGPPKSPSYPHECMPWSQTPVVSQAHRHLARPELLPSAGCMASAFLSKSVGRLSS